MHIYAIKLKSASSFFVSETLIGTVDRVKDGKPIELKDVIRFGEMMVHAEMQVENPKTKKKETQKVQQFVTQFVNDPALCSKETVIPWEEIKYLSKLDHIENKDMIKEYTEKLNSMRTQRSGLHIPNPELSQ